MNKPSAPRVAALRQRRAEAGLVRVELWATPEHAEKIKRYAQRLASRPAISSAVSR